MSQARRVLSASLAGSAIEWYEFFIYGTAASLVFGRLFFPDFDPLVGTLLSLSTFAAGFVARPLGSAVFGHFGDRVGRKSMLIITLSMMGIATFLTGLLPTYDQVGVWAPVLLVILRLIQGFSLGGEHGGSILMSVEHAGPNKRGLYGAIVNTGVGWGLLLATLVFLGLAQLDDEAFFSWGWRVPFLASIVLVAVAFIIRLKVEESPDFKRVQASGQVQKMPVVEVLKNHTPLVLLMCITYLSSGVSFYIATVFSLAYGTQQLNEDRGTILSLISISIVVVIIGMIIAGRLSDRFNRRVIFSVGILGMIIAPYAWFSAFNTGNFFVMLLGFLALLVPYAINFGVMPSYFVGVFPAHIRYTGLSLGYTLGAVIAGGLAPIIATSLLAQFGNWLPIAIYMSGVGVLSAIGTIFLKDRYATDFKPAAEAAPDLTRA